MHEPIASLCACAEPGQVKDKSATFLRHGSASYWRRARHAAPRRVAVAGRAVGSEAREQDDGFRIVIINSLLRTPTHATNIHPARIFIHAPSLAGSVASLSSLVQPVSAAILHRPH